MRTYLAILVAAIGSVFAVLMVLSGIGVYACHGCHLVKYQEAKLRQTPAVDTVFLGDSSLGYALDARHFSSLSGRLTLNLALQGWNYSMPGMYGQLAHALSVARPRNVVLMLTPQTFSKSIPALEYLPIRGYVQTLREQPALLYSVNLRTSLYVTRELARYLFDQKYLVDGFEHVFRYQAPGPPCPACVEHDYLAPIHKRIDLNAEQPLWPLPIPSDYVPFFEAVAALCEREALNCLYMHGTLFEKTAEKNRAFIAELAKTVARSGLKVPLASPILIPAEELGNTVNHIRPQYREAYTQKIYALLAPHLR